jgi:ATP-dependent Zn protease
VVSYSAISTSSNNAQASQVNSTHHHSTNPHHHREPPSSFSTRSLPDLRTFSTHIYTSTHTFSKMKRNIVIFLIILILFILIALIAYLIYYLQTRMAVGGTASSGSDMTSVA